MKSRVLYSSTMQFIQPILKLMGAGYGGHAVPCGLRAGRVKSEDPRRYTRMQAQYTDAVSRMQLAVSTHDNVEEATDERR
jgi:hypothetical protein